MNVSVSNPSEAYQDIPVSAVPMGCAFLFSNTVCMRIENHSECGDDVIRAVIVSTGEVTVMRTQVHVLYTPSARVVL